jgi:DNA mismatch repair ATPase MutS
MPATGEPTCLPTPLPAGELALAAQDIYDVCLTFQVEDRIVGNDLDADGKSLVMITGANQGGKSPLLRGLGLAHLMMQIGMFVGARRFQASVCAGVFTHYKREEDATTAHLRFRRAIARGGLMAGRAGPF